MEIHQHFVINLQSHYKDISVLCCTW